MQKLISGYFRFKRGLLHFCDLFIPSKIAKRNFVAWATFPRFDLTSNTTKYDKTINIAFCFNDAYIPLALTAISSLLQNSPGCKYDIYCVTDIDEAQQAKIKQFISSRHTNGRIIFMAPNHDYDGAHCGRWSHAIWWRCMLPKLLPDSVDKIIYADVDILFVRDLRDAFSIDLGTNLLAGCFDSPTYINSGFLVMNIAQFRQENIYPKMIEWAETHQTRCPDQDMLNEICSGRILSISRKFNTIIDGGYSFLKTMDLQQYRDLKNPVVLHYAGRYKPWKAEIKSFFTFDLYRRYYKTVTQDF